MAMASRCLLSVAMVVEKNDRVCAACSRFGRQSSRNEPTRLTLLISVTEQPCLANHFLDFGQVHIYLSLHLFRFIPTRW
ncbi:hypothetical protein BDQ12DRAFT_675504 [Crucibulum laeve]|uniref:Uncharacterized protein n=1 Tax=Crucibulum laeve TaxID=68775 RepID=A0A5C3MH99_9AGAR|nr:hypothetical protein BDQ12DRAFT_675504 [Crucibulum laeve]